MALQAPSPSDLTDPNVALTVAQIGALAEQGYDVALLAAQRAYRARIATGKAQ
jgi:hypothetical protein